MQNNGVFTLESSIKQPQTFLGGPKIKYKKPVLFPLTLSLPLSLKVNYLFCSTLVMIGSHYTFNSYVVVFLKVYNENDVNMHSQRRLYVNYTANLKQTLLRAHFCFVIEHYDLF